MAFLKKYVRKYWKPFCLAVAFLTLEAACDLMQPTIMARIVDIGIMEHKMNYVLSMGMIMLMITGLGACAAITRNILSTHVSQRFGKELRSDLFRKIQSLSFENIDGFETATLVTRLTNDVNQVQNFTNGMMRIFVKAPLLCIGSIIMATVLNPQLGLVLTLVVPLIAILMFLSVQLGYPFFRKVQKMLDGINIVMREYLSGVRVVKAFNRFDYETGRFANSNQELAAVSTKAMRVMAVFTPSITLTVNLGIIAVLWLGGIRVSHGQMHVGQVIAFVNYMTQILFSLMMISFVFTMFVRARASTERIAEVMTLPNTIKDFEIPLKSLESQGRVDFEHVYFAYNSAPEAPVLKDINFNCLTGETISIIGSTGTGKSSLVNLIPRFYEVTSGAVKVNGLSVKEFDLQQLREQIAVVPQKTVLFTGTIIDNIRWGKESATVEEVIAAAKVVQAHDFINAFPEKYDTLLGQGGVNLSGGQKQRIAIARALIRRPRILILDDSTSAVDMATEAKIRENMKQYAQGMTCFIITQRIIAAMSADRIIVLDRGEMVGLGTHQELLQNCNIYQDIYRSQIGKEGIINDSKKPARPEAESNRSFFHR
jgi:ATP-binding cassette subfamily B protein